jgi:hypothetical protein
MTAPLAAGAIEAITWASAAVAVTAIICATVAYVLTRP